MSGHRFTILFKGYVSAAQIERYAEVVDEQGGGVEDKNPKSFVATLTNNQFNKLQEDPLVDYIEPVGVVSTLPPR